MAPKVDDSDILNKIQGTYVPFLKKLIAFLEKNKKATPENLTKLKAIYTIFTTANSREQIETFHANQKKLENWYNKAQKEKHGEDGDTSKGKKRTFTCSDTESSQGACETPSATKKACTSFENSVDPDQPAILKVQSVASIDPATFNKDQQKDKEKEQQQQKEAEAEEPSDDDPVMFTCASCQFQTTEEAEFMKHARTDHRTDLSMWCKRCGKCFSNAGVLVSHIKDRKACAREEMVYRCGVKGCVFETASGQTFVHHLRHCHKGSPFIFCVHCQKIFTLPHCLILHMQDDCPFKDRNRRGGASAPATTEKEAPPAAVVPTPSPAPVSRPVVPIAPAAPRAVGPGRPPSSIVGRASPMSAPPTRGLSSVGRSRGGWGRGRGRGRGRLRHDSDEDTSDSDDPDDPSWRPDESLGEQGLRRSGRWAKRVNDVLNAEPSPSQQPQQGAAFQMQMVSCPCCDFLAAFQSVLEDHYIAQHKAPNKNACVVCKLKFENTPAFLQHFEEHRKGALPNDPPAPTATTPTPIQQKKETPKPPQPQKQQQQQQIQEEPPAKAVSENNNDSNSGGSSNNKAVLPLIAGEPGVVDATTCRQGAVKIPYQSAIHEKNNLRAGLGKFEELKSPSDLSAMRTEAKLRHLFKCALYSCPFTTDSTSGFEQHLRAQHSGRRLQCGYCFKEEASPVQLASHVASAHGERTFQCSGCFYRATSKLHLRLHARTAHPDGDPVRVLSCKEVAGEREQEEQPHTMWPYICAIEACSFSTYDPTAFKRHNETVHRTTSVYFCFYCKVDFLTFKRLMNHYRLHGLNLYQCQHCVHGAETEEEILAHLCNTHPDKEFKAYKREGAAQSEDGNHTQGEASTTTTKQQQPNNIGGNNSARSDEDELLYQAIDNECYPKHMRSRRRCYPRYLRHVATEVVCGRCADPTVYPSLEPYLAHLRDDHAAANYPCPHCWETCATVEDFRNHLLCHASKLYVCGAEGCSFYDWRKDTVTWHAKQKHKGDEEGPSSVALREFKALEDEENKVHALSAPPQQDGASATLYSCPFCGMKGKNRNLMKNHLYHELSYLRFECALCGKRCTSRCEVREHYSFAHPESDIASPAETVSDLESAVRAALDRGAPVDLGETTTCDACCTKFETTAMLQFHLRVCLRREYRPYECTPCNRRFATLLLLRHHADDAHGDPWTSVQFKHAPNEAVERDLGRNVQKVRLRQLKDALGSGAAAPAEECKVKFYTCSECPYEAHHKYNVERHARLVHGGAGRVMKGVESGAKQQRPFGCGHCQKRAWTRPEMERHVRSSHEGESGFFYYSPGAQEGSAQEECEVYECAYCKSTRESLSSLRKHSDLMHAESEFKVKGAVGPPPQGDALACGHCYLSVGGTEELRTHTGSAHPLMQPRPLGSAVKDASAPDDTNFPNKRVRFSSNDVHVCGHCGGAFSGRDQVATHSKRAHSRLPPRFDVLEAGDGGARFYKCEFCRFTGERRFLERHLSAKHRMLVTCRHCGKRFEFASRCKEHHEVAHPGLALSYSHETISAEGPQPQQPEEEGEDEPMEEDEDEPMEEEDELDLSSITVHMEVKDGESAELPLVYVTERFNLFPKVVLKDVMKGGH